VVRMHKLRDVSLVVIISVLAGIWCVGELAHRVYGPTRLAVFSHGVHADGWVENDAEISIAGLFTRGNYLEITWNAWRPAGLEPARMSAYVCGELVSNFVVTNEPSRFYLKGDCEPRVVKLKVENPFDPAGSDSRSLAARIESASVSSRFGVPLLAPLRMAQGIFAVFCLVLATFVAIRNPRYKILGCLAVVALTMYFLSATTAGPEKVFPLWLCLGSLLAGVAIGTIDTGKGIADDISVTAARYALLLILIAGAALRFYGIDFGLPANYHPDEVPKLNAIMRMVNSHTLNPDYFLHPTLLLYLTYFTNTLFHQFGMLGDFRDTGFLAGRCVSATAGTISLGLTYVIGARLSSRLTGLMAALLLAFLPLHVTCSRYLKEDALLTCMALATILSVVLAVKSERPRFLLLAGLFAGFTAGSKYSGILIVGVVGAAPWIASRTIFPDKRYIMPAILGCLIAPIGFLMCTPYAVLNQAKFINDFSAESRHMEHGHTTAIDAWSQLWMYHFARSVMPGVTIVLSVLSAIAMGFLLVKRRLEGLFLVGLVLLFYLPAEYVKAKPAPQPERYILPCLPLMMLCVSEMTRQLLKRKSAFIAAALVLAAIPAVRSIQLASEVRYDTREQLADWMKKNIPHGATVLLDWKPYGPRITSQDFNVVYIQRARIIPSLDVKALKSSGGDYLAFSSMFYDRYFSQPEMEPLLRQRIREVFERVPAVVEFSPKYGTYGFHNPTITLFSLKAEDFVRLDSEINLKREGKIEQTSNQKISRMAH